MRDPVSADSVYSMTLRAAFFDVGDTLVEHWIERKEMHARYRQALSEGFGERDWYDEWIRGDIEPTDAPDRLRQETLRWYEDWFRSRGIDLDGIDLDELRSKMCIPLDEVGSLSPGGPEAVRWCKARGMAVVLVSNTLSRGDQEVLEDWRRFGLSDSIDAVVTSHSVGWRKPHQAIFERALVLAEVGPKEAFHIGDNLYADVWGAKRLGIRAVWRRPRVWVDPRSAEPQTHPPNEVEPDATIESLTELPDVLRPWLARSDAGPEAAASGLVQPMPRPSDDRE